MVDAPQGVDARLVCWMEIVAQRRICGGYSCIEML